MVTACRNQLRSDLGGHQAQEIGEDAGGWASGCDCWYFAVLLFTHLLPFFTTKNNVPWPGAGRCFLRRVPRRGEIARGWDSRAWFGSFDLCVTAETSSRLVGFGLDSQRASSKQFRSPGPFCVRAKNAECSFQPSDEIGFQSESPSRHHHATSGGGASARTGRPPGDRNQSGCAKVSSPLGRGVRGRAGVRGKAREALAAFSGRPSRARATAQPWGDQKGVASSAPEGSAPPSGRPALGPSSSPGSRVRAGAR